MRSLKIPNNLATVRNETSKTDCTISRGVIVVVVPAQLGVAIRARACERARTRVIILNYGSKIEASNAKFKNRF